MSYFGGREGANTLAKRLKGYDTFISWSEFET
jgi:hypothetical protein